MAESSFVVGSDPAVPVCTFDVICNAVTTSLSIPAGAYYLYDATLARSLIDTFASVVQSHAQVATCSAFIGRDRKVHLSASPATAVTFTGSVHARDMMGITGNLSSATSHNATLISKFLWSPGKTETSDAIFGAHGLEVQDTKAGGSSTARQEWTHHNTIYTNDFSWRYVALDRVWTASELGGEHKAFWKEVLAKGYAFKLYRTRQDVVGDATDAALSAVTPLGPYKLRPDGMVRFRYSREFQFIDHMSPIELPVVKVPEYS